MLRSIYVCPYCFREHKRKDRYFRCMNRRCKSEPDQELAQYNGKAPELKQICFPYTWKARLLHKRKERCPQCGEITTTYVCPYCHNNIPLALYKKNLYLVSIVGAMDAGKSSYLAVLLHEVKKRMALSFGAVMSFMDDTSAREYEERFLRYLYPLIGTEPSIRIPKTRSSLLGMTYQMPNRPILMNYKYQDENDMAKSNTIVFYDSAGEDYEEQEMMFTLSKQITYAKGILFFVDPTKLLPLANSISKEQLKGASTVEPWNCAKSEDIFLRMVRLIRSQNAISENAKISVPIAIVCTKLDAVREHLSSSSPLIRESPHYKKKKFDEQDAWDVEQEVISLFHAWGEDALLSQVEQEFSNYHYFAVSALGNNPDEYGRMQQPRPHRVEDPFLWILKQNNIIR